MHIRFFNFVSVMVVYKSTQESENDNWYIDIAFICVQNISVLIQKITVEIKKNILIGRKWMPSSNRIYSTGYLPSYSS